MATSTVVLYIRLYCAYQDVTASVSYRNMYAGYVMFKFVFSVAKQAINQCPPCLSNHYSRIFMLAEIVEKVEKPEFAFPYR